MKHVFTSAIPAIGSSYFHSLLSSTTHTKKEGAMLRHRPIILKTLAVGVLLLLNTTSALAITEIIHGHTGHVQSPTKYYSATPYDYGLDLRVKPGYADWVHYSLPVSSTATVRYVGIYVYLGDANNIQEVRVKNGTTTVKRFTTAGFVKGWNIKILDLGQYQAFPKGLGISMQLVGGFSDWGTVTDNRIIIQNVQAHYAKNPLSPTY